MKTIVFLFPKNLFPRLIYQILGLICFMSILLLATTAHSTSTQEGVLQPAHRMIDHTPKIQISILLDTSNSMDGLINQTRAQLWQMIDEFSHAKKQGMNSRLEVAVYEYGNNRLSASSGYVRQVTGLTTDLDRVSEALFSLTTNGGSEYCGYAIHEATHQLQWSPYNQDIKAIFIAGNEPFTQGPIAFSHAISAARSKGITVNTIFAGNYQEGLSTGWQQGALLAGGDYMSIDHNHQVSQIATPQDHRITDLNTKLNQTYIPYGHKGQAAAKRQQEQDANSHNLSPATLVQRTKSKASAAYKNSNWDLVDAMKEGEVEVDKLDTKALPAPMKGMSTQEKITYIEEKAEARAALKKEIVQLNQQREAYIRKEQAKTKKSEAKTISDALSSAIRKEGEKKQFTFE